MTTSSNSLQQPRDDSSLRDAYLCEFPSQDTLDKSAYQMDKLISKEDYILEPFHEDLIERHEWMHVLSTTDVCTLPQGTKFCDENGYEVIPIQI